MKKVLVALLGLILIGILTYFCFQDKVGTIREELESQANTALISNELIDAKAQLIGHGFATTTIMQLIGSVPSAQEKEKATHLVQEISGVSGVDNQLKVSTKLIEQPILEDVIPPKPVIPSEPKEEEAVVPSPYLFDAVKEDNGSVLLSGYVNNEEHYMELRKSAYDLFGENNITDNLKVAQGAPENWDKIIQIGLDKLKIVDYGEMKLYNTDYAFNGHLTSDKASEIKSTLLKDVNQTISQYDNFSGNFEIRIPKAKIAKKELKLDSTTLCQKALFELSSKQKILFEYNKADIKDSSLKSVNNVVNILKKCQLRKTEFIEVGGHTDSIGNALYNKKLSQKRADSVKEYLIKQGIDKDKIKSHGYGEKVPIVSNMLKDGRAKNRRIEFNIKEIK